MNTLPRIGHILPLHGSVPAVIGNTLANGQLDRIGRSARHGGQL
jgi:hypothetical protein